MLKKFKVGVIGVGFIGAAHIEQLRRMGNVEVVALADDIDHKDKAEALSVPRSYKCYKDLIDNEQLDCIHICTPNNSHYEIAKYAIQHGIHIVLEKPMTTTVEEAEDLLALAKEKNLVHAMNFNYRFYPMVYQMREMIKNGELGDVFSIHGGYLQDWLFYNTDYNWRLEPEQSGESRAFADIGSHWFDLVEFVTGLKVTEVLADFATFHKTRKKPKKAIATYSGSTLRPEDYEEVPVKTEDYATVLFHFDNGAHACCNVTQVFAGRKNQMIVSISGSKCSLHWDSENSNELWIGRRGDANSQLVKDPSILAPGTAKITGYPGGHVEGFPDSFLQNFKLIYSDIENGVVPNPDYADFLAGIREMKVGEKVIQSAKERRWVEIG